MDTLPFVMVGHVDHGKSTLIGRLLYDTGSLPEDRMAEIRRDSEGKREVEFAHVMDHLEEERSRNITIDTAQTFFSTDRREYVLIDAPGHKEFLKNMITGASQARAAVLLVDAALGVEEQTRRHSYILRLLGLEDIIVAVNKMDLVDFSADRFARVEAAVRSFLSRIGLSPRTVIPLSARHGENVSAPSARLSWYEGPTFLQALDTFAQPSPPSEKPLRFPIQMVYRPAAGRKSPALLGRVETGRMRTGEEVLALPTGRPAKISSIMVWGRGNLEQAAAGESIGVAIRPDLPLERGSMLTSVENPPVITDNFRAIVFWMDPSPLSVGEELSWRCATREIPARVARIRERIDSSTLEILGRDTDSLADSEAGDVEIAVSAPVVLESFYATPELGRFVLARGNRVVAGGIVTHPEGGEG